MLKNLQVLRAFAALSVVIHHYNFLNFKPGAFGVDIFFVISGFIISFTIEKNSRNFLLKRLLRIAPTYYLATLFTITIWFLNPAVFKTTIVNLPAVIKSFLFIPYYKGPVLGLGYTLNYEMYFYLVVALCLKFTNTSKQALFFTSFFITAVFIINKVFFGQYVVLNFYGSDVVFEFIYGIILYFIYKNLKQKYISHRWFKYGLVLCIVAIISLIYIGYPEVPIEMRGILFGVPAFIICAVFAISDDRFKISSVIYDYLYKLGNASYMMYLVHPFVIFGILRLVDPLFNPKNLILTAFEFLIAISLVCLVSLILYNQVELPIQKFLKSKLLTTQEKKFK